MRVSLLLLIIGIFLVSFGVTGQLSPQCNTNVDVRIVSRNVYDQIIKDSVFN